MSSDQVYYNEANVILDGIATVLIEGKVLDQKHRADGLPVKTYTVTVKDYEGKIAQELVVRADEINLVMPIEPLPMFKYTTQAQFNQIVDNMEAQLKNAQAIVDSYADGECPDSFEMLAAGLFNFLVDIGAEGYEI